MAEVTLYKVGTAGFVIEAVDGTADSARLVSLGLGVASPTAGLEIADAVGSAASLQLTDGSSAAVSAAASGRLRYDEVGNVWEVSENGGAYVALVLGSTVSSVDGGVALFSGTSGRELKTTGVVINATDQVQNVETCTFNAEHDNGNSGLGPTIDWNNGQKQLITLTANAAFTFVDPPGPCNLILRVAQDATGGRTPTYPVATRWPNGGGDPSHTQAANAIDIVSFYYDGSLYWGQASFDFQA